MSAEQVDYNALVKELAEIIETHGISFGAKVSANQLRKATERLDLLGRTARRLWDSSMRVPEVIARLPADKKARAQEIMKILDEAK